MFSSNLPAPVSHHCPDDFWKRRARLIALCSGLQGGLDLVDAMHFGQIEVLADSGFEYQVKEGDSHGIDTFCIPFSPDLAYFGRKNLQLSGTGYRYEQEVHIDKEMEDEQSQFFCARRRTPELAPVPPLRRRRVRGMWKRLLKKLSKRTKTDLCT